MHDLRAPSRVGDVEHFADELAAPLPTQPLIGVARDQAIEALVLALASDWVRTDADAEDAVCSALVRIGVMRRRGNLVFEFVADEHMTERDRSAVDRYRGWIPGRYGTVR
jgi:hypothetical protein